MTIEGDWLGWVMFFLEAIERQAANVVDRDTQRLRTLRDEWREQVATARSSGLLALLVDALFETPAITINRAAAVVGVTYRAARLNVEELVDAGIVEEVTGKTRNRLFLATCSWLPRYCELSRGFPLRRLAARPATTSAYPGCRGTGAGGSVKLPM